MTKTPLFGNNNLILGGFTNHCYTERKQNAAKGRIDTMGWLAHWPDFANGGIHAYASARQPHSGHPQRTLRVVVHRHIRVVYDIRFHHLARRHDHPN